MQPQCTCHPRSARKIFLHSGRGRQVFLYPLLEMLCRSHRCCAQREHHLEKRPTVDLRAPSLGKGWKGRTKARSRASNGFPAANNAPSFPSPECGERPSALDTLYGRGATPAALTLRVNRGCLRPSAGPFEGWSRSPELREAAFLLPTKASRSFGQKLFL